MWVCVRVGWVCVWVSLCVGELVCECLYNFLRVIAHLEKNL